METGNENGHIPTTRCSRAQIVRKLRVLAVSTLVLIKGN